MKKVLLFYIFSLLSEQLFAQYKVQFIVEDLSIEKHDSIYIAGTFTEWGTGNLKYLLKPLDGTKKSITLDLPGGKQEYKFTRGGWLLVERDNECIEIENRKIEVHRDTVVYVTVPFWRDECTVEHLKKVLEKEKTDTGKVIVLFMMTNSSFDSSDIQHARLYAEEALNLSEKINYNHGKEGAYMWMGDINTTYRNYAEARKWYYNSIKAYEDAGEENFAGGRYLDIADTYWGENNYPEALNYSYKAIKLLEGTGNPWTIINTYTRIGNYYESEENYEEALQNYFKALHLAEEIGAGGFGKSSAGMSNRGLANVYNKLGRYKEGLQRDSIALRIFQELGAQFVWHLYETHRSLADIFKKQGDIAFASGNKTLAGIMLSEASKNYLASVQEWGNVHAYTSLGQINISLHKLSSAKKYMQQSLVVAKATGRKSDWEECYRGLAALDSAEGNFSGAFEHYKMYILYRDSIYNKENTEKATRIKMQYQFDKKEDSTRAEQDKRDAVIKAELNNQKTIRNFSFVLAFSILAFSGYSFYRYKKKKQLQNQQALMNERLRISRELHDEVGATLSGIAMYSHLTKEQIKQSNTSEVEKSLNIMQQSAGEMVNKLNDIVWLINPDQDSLQKLIQRLEEYARDMAAIKNMQVKVNVPDNLHEHSLPMESRRNIYLFCKEAINNAVKYSGATLLELNVKKADNKLEFSVSDNGKGFDAVMVRRGNGLDNMQKRADEIGAKLMLQSKQTEGAMVSMQIKITH